LYLQRYKPCAFKVYELSRLKNKRINIRITEKDLLELKQKSLKEGMPYQTFISSMIHKMATGQLKAV